jgi:ArsR family transcriptional regulator
MTVQDLDLVGLLRVLGDPTRLRLLALLAHAELSVGEMARALAMGQSRVSNHLKVLREHELILERHEGSVTYGRLAVPGGPAGDLWRALEPSLGALAEREADERRLAEVLAARSDARTFFDRIAGDWDLIGSDFTRGTGRLEVLGCLVPAQLVVADVGCGTGYLARALGRRVRKVVCVDTSPAMLERAREKLAGLSAEVDLRVGSMESLPIADGEVDAACAHMVLHHLADVREGLSELARVTRPGGRVVCLDLLPHREAWMHQGMADARLGLDPAALAADMRAVGLADAAHELLDDSYVVETPAGRKVQLPLLLAHARRP